MCLQTKVVKRTAMGKRLGFFFLPCFLLVFTKIDEYCYKWICEWIYIYIILFLGFSPLRSWIRAGYFSSSVIGSFVTRGRLSPCICVRATSHTRLRARDHDYTSSTLIGGRGVAGLSSLQTTLEGPMEYANARWM